MRSFSRHIVNLILGTVLLASCSSAIGSVEEFNDWLNDHENGCVKTKQIAGFDLTVKYNPPKYLVLKHVRRHKNNVDKIYIDSMLNGQNKALSFLMTIGPDKAATEERRASSVMFEQVSNQKEFTERVLSVNFFMDQHVKLFIDGTEHLPLFALVDNVYELSDSRSFVVVFASEQNDLLKGKEYLFEYDDPFFGMGKVQFDFAGERLAEARDVQVLWN